jgi:hypothetical protein
MWLKYGILSNNSLNFRAKLHAMNDSLPISTLNFAVGWILHVAEQSNPKINRLGHRLGRGRAWNRYQKAGRLPSTPCNPEYQKLASPPSDVRMYALEILTRELAPIFEHSFDEASIPVLRTLVLTMSFSGNPFGLSLHDLNLYHTRDMVQQSTWLFLPKTKALVYYGLI